MTEIICLANSWKHEERCIAGINPQTGRWIRPIYPKLSNDGRVPSEIRLIEGEEPQLLDVIDIPLEKTGDNFGFESENLNIASGKWRKIKTLPATDVLKYCSEEPEILHNHRKFVCRDYLQHLPLEKRQTLQLVYALKVIINREIRSTGIKWRGSLITQQGQLLTDASITDPEFVKKLDDGEFPVNPCIVTVSLSMPHRPLDWEGSDPCWKLIAGVIELSDLDLILVEMERIGWTIDQGRDYLQHQYHKRSRYLLTDDQVQEFLDYLKSQTDKPNSSTDISQPTKLQNEVRKVQQSTSQKAYCVKEIQKTYARTYTSWTKEDDERLKQRYDQGATINDLVRDFQRKPGGIRSRLKKLGLL